MESKQYKRIPKHLGIIPDGNRRWAVEKGFEKKDGYNFGLEPGFKLYDLCLDVGIDELTFYGFTHDNTKRPREQTEAFKKACVEAVFGLANKDAELLIVGNSESKVFPTELRPYMQRKIFGKGLIKINFLVNYDWNWDLNYKKTSQQTNEYSKECKCEFSNEFSNLNSDKHSSFERMQKLPNGIASSEISRLDLIIRWGGRCRLSGFLPIQSIYADFYVVDDMWPDFKPQHFYNALNWYQQQDVTLGG